MEHILENIVEKVGKAIKRPPDFIAGSMVKENRKRKASEIVASTTIRPQTNESAKTPKNNLEIQKKDKKPETEPKQEEIVCLSPDDDDLKILNIKTPQLTPQQPPKRQHITDKDYALYKVSGQNVKESSKKAQCVFSLLIHFEEDVCTFLIFSYSSIDQQLLLKQFCSNRLSF